MDKLSDCPSEVITMLLGHLEDISDLENVMLACPRIWRCLEHDSYLLPTLNELLTRGSVPSQIAFPMLLATHIRHRSPLVRTYLDKIGLNLLKPGFGRISDESSISEGLPSDMTPLQVRSLLTTSSAIRATALQCLASYAARFHAMQPYTTWVLFEQHEEESNSMPAMSRYPVPDTGPLRWPEYQRALKGFWMVYTARLFLAAFEQGAYHDWPPWTIAEISRAKAVDLFSFPIHGQEYYRKRPRDYLLTVLHLYLGAEDYLQDLKAGLETPSSPPTQFLLPCRQKESEGEIWPHKSETMEYFVKMFKEIRSQRDGDGFKPWRRLGLAIWDTDRLERAGLINDISKDTRPHVVHWLSKSRSRDLDRIRWLSVIREEDMPIVRNHRLTVDEEDRNGYADFEYPEDSDESESWRSF